MDDAYFAVEQKGYTESNGCFKRINYPEVRFIEGDTVGIELNTKDRTITYCVNNKDQATIFKNIEQKTYFLALTFRSKNNSVEITDFVGMYIHSE